jgi:hypothetical protein
MPKYLGRAQFAFDERTGKKVRARDLIEDGEIKGLRVSRRESDAPHPQKYARRIGPDGPGVYRPVPDLVISAVSIQIGYDLDANDLGGSRLFTPDMPLYIGGFAVEFAAPAPGSDPVTFDTTLTTFDSSGVTWDQTIP